MKKITLFVAALLVFGGAVAQELTAVSNTTGTVSPPDGDILWDQQSVGGNGIVSDFNVDEDFGVWSSDDFNLSEERNISTITAYGFQNNGDLENFLNSLQVYIYGNLNGFDVPDSDPTQPGTGLLELDIPAGDPSLTITQDAGFEFIIDVTAANGGPLNLPAGDYWLVVAPALNALVGMDGPSRWNWFDAGVPGNGVNEAHLIDPADFFAAGATAWTSLTDLGVTFASVAFTIEGGDPVLSVGDNDLSQVSIFPNPATDRLNVQVPAGVEVIDVALFDVLGKQMDVAFANGTININTLSRGVYIVQVNTNKGTLTQKVIKR